MLRLIWNAVSGLGSQNFLGYRWLPALLNSRHPQKRRAAALSLLSLSPHYFYRTAANARMPRRSFLESEYTRNLDSRHLIIDRLVRKYLRADQTVLDYGCGPGFLAFAAAPWVDRVIACDLSSGVLACARIVNARPNIEYRELTAQGQIPVPDDSVDTIYCFAVIQHVTDDVFASILSEWWRVARPGATAICHVVVDAPGWKTEDQWRADQSLRGRARWRLGLHCFTRSPLRIARMVEQAGFSSLTISPVRDLAASLNDDIDNQHLCVFRKAD